MCTMETAERLRQIESERCERLTCAVWVKVQNGDVATRIQQDNQHVHRPDRYHVEQAEARTRWAQARLSQSRSSQA